jgi:hypothetical protein
VYVYIPNNSTPGQYDVGFYLPNNGRFVVESTQANAAAAAARVSWLNGGAAP